MKYYFLLALLLVCVIEVYPNDLDLESNLDEVLKANNITIPEMQVDDIQATELILDLKEENFKKFIQENPNVFVYFYVPFCSTCKEFTMLLEELAQNSNESNLAVKFVKIDSDKYPTASESFQIKEYPASFFIKNETMITSFEGEKTLENLLQFIHACINATYQAPQSNNNITESSNEFKLQEINDLNTLNNILSSNNIKNILLYLGDSRHLTSVHQQFTKENNILLYYSISSEVLNHFSVNPEEFEVVHYKYSNKNKAYNKNVIDFRRRNIRLDIINELIATSINNSASQLNDKNLDRILDTGFPSVVIILPDFSNNTLIEYLMNEMNVVRKQFPRDVWYFVTSFKEPNVKVFLDLLRITPEMVPTVIIFDGSAPKENNSIKKFLWNRGEINSQNLKSFVQDFYNNSLQFYLASEDVPSQPLNDFGVYKVVSKTFPEVVLQSTGKEILLLLCTEYHDDCSKLKSIYNNVGRKLAGNEKLIVGIIDPASNEIDNLSLDFIPYLMFLHDTPDKLANHIKFEGNFTTQQMVEFVMNNTKHNVNEIALENQTEIYEAEKKIKITRKSIEEDANEEEESDNENDGNDMMEDISELGFGNQGGESGRQLEELFKNLLGSGMEGLANGMGTDKMDLGSLGGDGGFEELMKQEMNKSEMDEETSKENTETSSQSTKQTEESHGSEVKQDNQPTQTTEVHTETNHVKEDF